MERGWSRIVFGIGAAATAGMMLIAFATLSGAPDFLISSMADILGLAFVAISIAVSIGVPLSKKDSASHALNGNEDGRNASVNLSGMIVVNASDGEVSIANDAKSIRIDVRSSALMRSGAERTCAATSLDMDNVSSNHQHASRSNADQ